MLPGGARGAEVGAGAELPWAELRGQGPRVAEQRVVRVQAGRQTHLGPQVTGERWELATQGVCWLSHVMGTLRRRLGGPSTGEGRWWPHEPSQSPRHVWSPPRGICRGPCCPKQERSTGAEGVLALRNHQMDTPALNS